MDCGLADALAARAGEEAPVDARMLVPPPFLDGRASPRADGKAVYGQPLAHVIDTENFTVEWSDPSVDPDVAADIAEALESGWDALVEAGGWPQPVSSDRYLLWVLLDPTMTTSGFTTTYETADYPDGYPVMYVNPAFEPDYPQFQRSVGVHEFGHALQYRLRPYSGGADSWYWEATSEWQAELGLPDADTYAWSTYWYADAPDARFDSLASWHQYGMLLLNAYLDEYAIGSDGIRDVWIAGEGGGAWEDLVADAVGTDFGDVVADMSGALAAGALRESALYYVPEPEPVDAQDTLDMPGLYGTRYVSLAVDAPLDVTGDVRVRYATDGTWSDAPPGDVVTFTALSEGGEIAFGPTSDDEPEVRGDPPEDEAPAGCGCASGTSPAWLSLAPALAALRRRARSPRRGRPSGGR